MAVAVGCIGTRVHVGHARLLMCMLGCWSNLVMGKFRENIPSCRGKNKGQFTALPPLALPLTLRLQAEGGLLYLDEGSGTAQSWRQGFGEKSSAAGRLHRPLCASLTGADRVRLWSLAG